MLTRNQHDHSLFGNPHQRYPAERLTNPEAARLSVTFCDQYCSWLTRAEPPIWSAAWSPTWPPALRPKD
jgi:hypothetical protein